MKLLRTSMNLDKERRENIAKINKNMDGSVKKSGKGTKPQKTAEKRKVKQSAVSPVTSDGSQSESEGEVETGSQAVNQKVGKSKKFTDAEMEVLLKYVFKYHAVVEGNLSSEPGGLTRKAKDDTWKHIAGSVNAIGVMKRTWQKVRDKWQDLRSKTVRKETYNKNKTGNMPAKQLSKWEAKVLDFLISIKSNIVAGIAHGIDSADGEAVANVEDALAVKRVTLEKKTSDRKQQENEGTTQAPVGEIASLLNDLERGK